MLATVIVRWAPLCGAAAALGGWATVEPAEPWTSRHGSAAPVVEARISLPHLHGTDAPDEVDPELVRLGLLQDAAADAPPPAAEKEWKSKFVLALTGSWGNTDTQSMTAGITSVREKDVHKTTLDAAYFYGATDGDRTDNKFTAGARHDWSIRDTRWFFFGQAR